MQLNRRTLVTLPLAFAALGAGRDGLDQILSPSGGMPMASAGIMARGPDGRLKLSLSGGLAQTPDGARAFRPDQPFRVASVSKMFAAICLVRLIPEGLDRDVSDILDFQLRHPSFPEAAITARMLLSHTGGLRNGDSYPVPFNHPLAEAFHPDGRHYDAGTWFGPAEHAPGSWFSYADVNFALAAQMVERLTGERFDLHVRRVLFDPAGLDIGYNWSGVSAARRRHAAAGLRRMDGTWAAQVDSAPPPWPDVALYRGDEPSSTGLEAYVPGQNGFAFAPQGGLRLSLSDMDQLAVRFAEGGEPLLPPALLTLMQAPQWHLTRSPLNGDAEGGVFQAYGLGIQALMANPGPSGDAYFGADSGDWRGHLGDAYGWMTGLFWNVKDRRTLVWAINGMPETGRPAARRSALSAPEEALIALALG